MRKIRNNFKPRFKFDFLSTAIAIFLIIWGVDSLYGAFFNAPISKTFNLSTENVEYAIMTEENKDIVTTQKYGDVQWSQIQNYEGISLPRSRTEQSVLVKIDLKDVKLKNPCVYFDTLEGESFKAYYNGRLIYSGKPGFLGYEDDLDKAKRNVIVPLGSSDEINTGGNEADNPLILVVEKGLNRHVGPVSSAVSESKAIVVGEQEDIISNVMKNSTQKVITNSIIMAAALIFMILSVFFKDENKRILGALSAFLVLMVIYGLSGGEEINLLVYNSPIIWNYLLYISLSLSPIAFVNFFEQVFNESYGFILEKLKYVLFTGAGLFMATTVIFTVSRGRISVTNIGIYVLYAMVAITCLMLLVIAFINAFKGDTEAIIFSIGLLVYVIYIANALLNGSTVSEGGLLLFILSLILLTARRFMNMAQSINENSRELEAKNQSLQAAWDEISKSKEEISELNKTLEQRVIDRTKELERSNEDLKKTLVKLEMTQDQLIQSEKMVALGGLVAGVSHEINTPVGVSVTAASHLQEKTKEFVEMFKANALKKSELEKYLNTTMESSEVILSNLQRASDLVKSFKQVAVDQSSEAKRRFKVYEYINQILLSLRPKLKKTKISVGINCDETLEIESFPGSFSQIVTNLIMNSLIHAFDENQEGTIIFDIEKKDSNIIFSYSDNGKGISKDIIGKIFDPFFTTKRGQGGTGLGLNIIYNIVTQTLGGTLTCESTEGIGTIFRIIFPVDNQ